MLCKVVVFLKAVPVNAAVGGFTEVAALTDFLITCFEVLPNSGILKFVSEE